MEKNEELGLGIIQIPITLYPKFIKSFLFVFLIFLNLLL